MSLIDLWNTARESIQDKHVKQVISFAGSGKLTNGNNTSKEFRDFLSIVPTNMLIDYANECLDDHFDQGGLVLQDIVNQMGRRLSFEVADGLYQGKQGSIGFDGLWKSRTDEDIVVEVKTTDTYRISLDKIALYRTKLIKEGCISDIRSSILIIVGRQDTGDLEAQIRGSRHAWDIRLISIEALIRLLQLKEAIDDLDTVSKITKILIPQEFTKVDSIIDLVFSTAEEVTVPPENEIVEPEEKEYVSDANTQQKLDTADFREQCILKISQKLLIPLMKQSRSTYRSSDGGTVVSYAISKFYPKLNRYWFAFHPSQKERLEEGSRAFAAFVCGPQQYIFMFPVTDFLVWLPGLNQTTEKKRNYWHVHIMPSDGRWILLRKPGYQHIDIVQYLI